VKVLAVMAVVATSSLPLVAGSALEGKGRGAVAGMQKDSVVTSLWRLLVPDGSPVRAPASGVSREPTHEYRFLPACEGNDANVEGADAGCAQAEAACPDDQVSHWLFQRPVGVLSAPWVHVTARCLGAEEAADPASIALPAFTLADFQRLPLPAGTPNIEPSNGYTLVGVPTNVYADAEPVTLDTELLGFPVQVRATPSRYSWDFGDGNAHGPTEDAGAPYPDLRITHEYASSGVHGVELTTYYSGEYSVAGGPWLPVPGEAEVTSGAVDVEALAGRNRLVADAGG